MASTNVLRVEVKNDLNETDDFLHFWYSYTTEEYMPRFALWACNYAFATVLESQIQLAMTKYCNIGTHINKPGMSWLGKIEHLNGTKARFGFSNYPNVDPTTRFLFEDLKQHEHLPINWLIPIGYLKKTLF